MFRGTSLASIVLLIGGAIHQYSYAQIINEKFLTDIPYISMLQCSNDEFIFVGTEKNLSQNITLVTLTKKGITGDVKWKKSYLWETDCTVKDAAILPDNSVIITGNARNSPYQSNPFLIKTDPNGDTLWTRYYNSAYQAEKVIGTYEGGYLLSYYSNGSGLLKLNSSGDSIWSRKISSGKPFGLAETAEAAYLTVDNEEDNIVLRSLGSFGEVLWSWSFGGPGTDQPSDVFNASNGDDYMFAGTQYNDKTKEDFFIGLVDCFGLVRWTKTFGGPGTDICYDLVETSGNDFIAIGISNSYNESGKFEYLAVKMDTHGNPIWTKTIPGKGNGNYMAKNIFETSQGSLIVAGPKLPGFTSADESYMLEFIFPTQFDISFQADRQIVSDQPFSVQFTNHTLNAEHYEFRWDFGDGESLTSNSSTVAHEYKEEGTYNVKLVAYENDFGSADSVVYEDYILIAATATSIEPDGSVQFQKLNIHPNPSGSKTRISFDNPDNNPYTLRMVDLNGKIIRKIETICENFIELDTGNIPPGVYFVELSGRITLRGKLLVE